MTRPACRPRPTGLKRSLLEKRRQPGGNVKKPCDPKVASRRGDTLAVQRKIGNRATARLFGAQGSFTVGPAGDTYEREADAVAARVARSLASSPSTTPTDLAPFDEAGRIQRIQRRPAQPVQPVVGTEGGDLDSDTHAALEAEQGRGRPLPTTARRSMEHAFGANFSGVRVHSGPSATDLNDRMQARAFTAGRDIYFRNGLPDLGTASGKELLAHELTHTIQQGGTGVARFTIRRTLKFSLTRIDETQSKAEQARGKLQNDTLFQIRSMVAAYHQTENSRLLPMMDEKCDDYLWKHRGDKGTTAGKRLQAIKDLKEAIKHEKVNALLRRGDDESAMAMSQQLAQERYLKDAYEPSGPTALKHQKPETKQHVHEPAKDLAAGKEGDPRFLGADATALRKIQKYKLTEAEILAIRTFTAPDYMYINPAAAFSATWMLDQNKGTDQRGLFEEGGLQAGVLMQALAKFPKKSGSLYRGARVSPTQLDEWYQAGKTVTFKSFSSTARNEGPARRFADGKGDVPPKPDQTVSVMCELHANNARKISDFSIFGKTEDEWLLLPGATFKIDLIRSNFKGDPGNTPAATAWKTVYLTQTH